MNARHGVIVALRTLFVMLALGAVPARSAESFADVRAAWNRPAEPFEVVPGVYYVGTEELAA